MGGYQTEADNHLKIAKGHVNKALKELSEIVIEECIGSDNYKGTFQADLRDALLGLLDVRETLRDLEQARTTAMLNKKR